MAVLGRCVSLERMLTPGASRPFLAADDQGGRWVVKWCGNPQGPAILVNELVVGRLARRVGLPWPRVGLVEIDRLTGALAAAGHALVSSLAVGIEFKDGLRAAAWPVGLKAHDAEFASKNRQYVQGLVDLGVHGTAFYGKNVLDNWMKMQDTKYDTLQVEQTGSVLFIDASLGFEASAYLLRQLEWSLPGIQVWSPYLEGIVVEPGRHSEWVDRVERVDEAAVDEAMGDVPESWGVSREGLGRLREFLMRTQREFVPLFRQWIRAEEQMTS